MRRNPVKVSAGKMVVLLLVLINAVILQEGLAVHPGWYQLLYITVPLLVIALWHARK